MIAVLFTTALIIHCFKLPKIMGEVKQDCETFKNLN